MRITFLLATIDINGGTKVIAEYGRQLLALGHDVKFVSLIDPKPGLVARLKDRLRGKRRPVTSLEYFSDIRDRLTILSKAPPIDYSAFPEADFLIATWWETVEWAQGAPKSAGRLAHLMQGYEMFSFMPQDRVRKAYEQDCLKISVSIWISEQVELHHGQASAAIIHNSVDTDFFAMKDFAPNQPLRLGFVSSQFSGKNTIIMSKVHQALQARGIAAEFLTMHVDPILGDALAGMPVECHHRPAQSEIPGLYQSCDLWLWPSLEEGFGLPILEALSCGTPVVASPAGAAPQLIRSGVNGYLTPSDPEAFADQIARYIQLSREERRAMSQNARDTVLNWSWRDAAKRMEHVLQKHL